MHISYTKSFNIPVSIVFATLVHMINVYEICLNTKKLSDIQYARFHILPVDLHFETVWSAGVPTMIKHDKLFFNEISLLVKWLECLLHSQTIFLELIPPKLYIRKFDSLQANKLLGLSWEQGHIHLKDIHRQDL